MQAKQNAGTAAFAKKKIAEISDDAQALKTQIYTFTKEKTAELATLAAEPRVQVAAASGVGGAVVVGTGGAGVGALAGGTVGAAIGIVPAVFTLGLSIPVFGAIGAGCGAVAGGATGGAVGFTGAGAMGYHAYAKRAEIRNVISRLQSRLPVRMRMLPEAQEQEEVVDLSPMSPDLEGVSAKLDATKESLAPWLEIRDLKDQVGAMQQSIGQQMESAKQPTRRRSLSELSEKLAHMGTSLDNAESSWDPWTNLTNAKQHLGRAQDVVAQHSPRGPRLVGA